MDTERTRFTNITKNLSAKSHFINETTIERANIFYNPSKKKLTEDFVRQNSLYDFEYYEAKFWKDVIGADFCGYSAEKFLCALRKEISDDVLSTTLKFSLKSLGTSNFVQ